MERSRRIVVLAHCLLNANARVAGIARYAGQHPVVERFAARGIAVLQLPCPEVGFEGIERPPRTLEEYDTIAYREHCAALVRTVAAEVSAYREAGCDVGLVVGVEGSPSCAVEVTNLRGPGGESERAPGTGVFMHELALALEPMGVRLVGVDHRDDDLGVARCVEALESIGWA